MHFLKKINMHKIKVRCLKHKWLTVLEIFECSTCDYRNWTVGVECFQQPFSCTHAKNMLAKALWPISQGVFAN